MYFSKVLYIPFVIILIEVHRHRHPSGFTFFKRLTSRTSRTSDLFIFRFSYLFLLIFILTSLICVNNAPKKGWRSPLKSCSSNDLEFNDVPDLKDVDPEHYGYDRDRGELLKDIDSYADYAVNNDDRVINWAPLWAPGSSVPEGKSNLPPDKNPLIPINTEPTFDGSQEYWNNWFTWSDLLPYMWDHWVNWKSEWSNYGFDILPWITKFNSSNSSNGSNTINLGLWGYSAPKWFSIFFWHIVYARRWHKGIALRNNDLDNEIVIPYKIRGSGAYQYEVYEKLDNLLKAVDRLDLQKGVIHLRLSPQIGRFNNIFECLKEQEQAWEKLHKVLQRGLFVMQHGSKDSKQKYSHFEYLKVVEPHKSGFPHLHILIFGVPFLIAKEKIDEAWDRYGMGNKAGVWIESVTRKGTRGSKKDVLKIVKYMTKYISKSFRHPLWVAIMFLMHMKTFTASKGISAILKNDKEKVPGWLFLGVDFLGLLLRVSTSNAFHPLETFFELKEDTWSLETKKRDRWVAPLPLLSGDI